MAAGTPRVVGWTYREDGHLVVDVAVPADAGEYDRLRAGLLDGLSIGWGDGPPIGTVRLADDGAPSQA